MQHEAFRAWLGAQDRPRKSVADQIARLRRVEQHYGDLDPLFDQDQLQGLLTTFAYTAQDQAANRPNPTELPISATANLYNNLVSYRYSMGLYVRFRIEGLDGVEELEADEEAAEGGAPIGLERDMQAALRRNLDQLEPGLTEIDGGNERRVDAGFIDITAQDAAGSVVVIELKAGRATREAIGQILSYMGDVKLAEPTKEVRGVLIAADFDHRTKAAASMVPSIKLKAYRVRFEFTEPV